MARKSIKKILEQRDRAIRSLNERRDYKVGNDTATINAYIKSQKDAYVRNGGLSLNSTLFAVDKSNKRRDQIYKAAENEIAKLQKQGKVARAARKAQGLSVG